MKQDIEKCIQLAIDVLNGQKSDNGQTVLTIIRQLYEQPYKGKGLGLGPLYTKGFRNTTSSRKTVIQNAKSIDGSLAWKEALLVLFDFGNYSEEEMLAFTKKLNDAIIFNHVLVHIISNVVVAGNITEAEKYIQYFKPVNMGNQENNQDKGYLPILNYYADMATQIIFSNILKRASLQKIKAKY